MKKLSGHRVLISNDDGIHAPGIQLLEKIVRQDCDDVWVVAPDEERSGASHSVSMHNPIRVRKLDDRHFSVKGSPTDCVLMALHELMDEHPTLVLSGINRGPNLADDTYYSGTVAVAIEATLMGIPAIAMSQAFIKGSEVHWEMAEHYAPCIIEHILEQGIPRGTLLNVNFPPVPVAESSGVRVVRQGRRPPGAFKIDARVDRRDVPYYWVHLSPDKGDSGRGTDLEAVEAGAVAVCPLKLDMTDLDYHKTLAEKIPQ